MASIAADIRDIDGLLSVAKVAAETLRVLAWLASAAFCRVMSVIKPTELAASSSDAACSWALDASDSLLREISSTPRAT